MLRRRKPAIAAASVLVVLGVVELALRSSREWPVFVGTTPFEPDLGCRMAPGAQGIAFDLRGKFSYRLSSLGFRGPELPGESEPRPPGRVRILFVGDSFLTPNVRDEELIQSACTRRLEERGIAAEAYTLCCNDYATAQELMLLERYGERVRPDVVVLEVYASNDVGANSLELAGRLENCAGDYVRPYLIPRGEDFELTWAQPVRSFLRRHLLSFALLDRALIARAKEGGLFAWYAPWPLTLPSPAERARVGLTPSEWYEVFREHAPDHPWERAWQVTERLIAAVADRSRLLGARFLVLVIPAIAQAELNASTFQHAPWAEKREEPAVWFDMNHPERRLAAFSERTGIEMRLLLEPLRALAREGRTSYLADGHLNGRGSTLGGKITADWIAGGDGFPAARPDATLSSPTRLLPPAESAPRLLELRNEYEPLLGPGWFPYLDARSGRLWWASSPASMVLLPLRAGDRLVVTGWLPPHASLPSTFTLSVDGNRAVRKLQAAGTFRVRLDVSSDFTGSLKPVQLAFSASFKPDQDWRAFGAFINSIELREGRHRQRDEDPDVPR